MKSTLTTPEYVKNRDGIWWMDAPLPPRLHRCKPWTTAYPPFVKEETWRCACGAIGWPDLGWTEKNARRR